MPLRRAFRVASLLWGWYATVAGIMVLALGAAYAILLASAGTGQVFDVVRATPGITTTKQGGTITYTWTQDRHENCPGKVVSRFTPVGGKDTAVIQQERPVAYTEARFYPELQISIVLPQSVTPGRWRLLDGVQSECLDRSRYDRIIEFEFNVTG